MLNKDTHHTMKDYNNSPSLSLPSISLICLAIILLAFNMRSPIVLLGSIAPLLEHDLSIGQVEIGWLGAIPMLMFSLGALLSARFSRHFGLHNMLPVMIGMLIMGMVLRSVLVSWEWFFVGTLLLSLAVGFLNTLAMPAIKGLAPQRIPLVTGLYSLTMTIMAGLVAGVIVPISEQVGWQWASGGWAVISLVALFVWLNLRPSLQAHINRTQPVTVSKVNSLNTVDANTVHSEQSSRQENCQNYNKQAHTNKVSHETIQVTTIEQIPPNTPKTTTKSIWKTPMAWYLAIFLGVQSLMYYTLATFLPSIWVSEGLSMIQAGQMAMVFQIMSPIAIASLTFLMNHAQRKQKDYARMIAVTASALIALGSLGMTVADLIALTSSAMLVWAGVCTVLLGLGTSGVFTLSIMLMSLRTYDTAHAGDFSGMSQAVGYAVAMFGPLGMGWLLEMSGSFQLPLMILTALMVLNIGFAWLASRAVMVDGKEIVRG